MSARNIYFYTAACAILCGTVIGVLGRTQPLVLILCGLIGTVLVLFHELRNNSTACFVGVFLLVLPLATIRAESMPQKIPERFMPLLGTYASLEGTVVAMPDVRETANRLTIETTQGDVSTRLIASVPLYPSVSVGDFVHVSGVLMQPKPFATDGGRAFHYDSFLAKDGIFAVMNRAKLQRISMSDSYWLRLLRALEYVKEKTITALERCLTEPESALAVGILIGGKQGLGKELLNAFTISGMLQIVVLSGYNVMIVAETILMMPRRFPRKIASVIAGASIVLFVLLAGSGSSAIRAGFMATLGLLARATGRPYDVIRVLTLTLVIMTLINPLSLVYDPGLQFSFLATYGLIIGTPIILRQLLFIPYAFIRELLATTISAQIGVLPILLWQTGNLSLVSLLTNAITMPVIPFAMAASAVAGALSFFISSAHPVALAAIGTPAYAALWYVINVATFAASLPYANIILPAFSFWFVVIVYSVLGLLAWWYVRRAARLKSLAAPTHSHPITALPAPT